MSLWQRVLAERRGLVIPLLAAVAVNIAVLVLVVFPLQASVAGDEERATTAQMALGEARRAERSANDTRASKVRADEELKTFYADVLPSNLSVARNLLFLQVRTLSRENGLDFSSSSYEPEEVKGSALMRFRVDISLTGEYANVRGFLYELETSEGFFVVESVKLGQSNSEGGKGSLEVVLSVATYYSSHAGAASR